MNYRKILDYILKIKIYYQNYLASEIQGVKEIADEIKQLEIPINKNPNFHIRPFEKMTPDQWKKRYNNVWDEVEEKLEKCSSVKKKILVCKNNLQEVNKLFITIKSKFEEMEELIVKKGMQVSDDDNDDGDEWEEDDEGEGITNLKKKFEKKIEHNLENILKHILETEKEYKNISNTFDKISNKYKDNEMVGLGKVMKRTMKVTRLQPEIIDCIEKLQEVDELLKEITLKLEEKKIKNNERFIAPRLLDLVRKQLIPNKDDTPMMKESKENVMRLLSGNVNDAIMTDEEKEDLMMVLGVATITDEEKESLVHMYKIIYPDYLTAQEREDLDKEQDWYKEYMKTQQGSDKSTGGHKYGITRRLRKRRTMRTRKRRRTMRTRKRRR
jgi:hypothetical protein